MASRLDDFKKVHNDEKIDTSKKLRVGIIGTGWIAEVHVISYLKQPDVEIVAGADIIPGKAEAFFKRLGVEGVKCDYKSGEEMVNDKSLALDAVSICTYNRQHAPCAIQALNAGVNVLLEKPFTVTLDEAVEVMRAEKKSGKILSIGFQPRFDPNMKELKDIVESGVLGNIYYIQTGGGRRRGIPTPFGTSFIEDKTAGIGALGDIGCYSLDMIMNAIGHPKPVSVTGIKSNCFGRDPKYIGYKMCGHPEYHEKFEVDDFAAAFIRFETGLVIDFRISWAMNMDTSGDTLIYGTKGGLRIPSTECWNGSVGGDFILYHEVGGEQVETVIKRKRAEDRSPDGKDNFYYKIRTFLDAVKNGTPSPVPSSQIIYNQAMLDGIARSAECGREVEIVIPEI